LIILGNYSRFGGINSRLGQHKFPFRQLRELSRKALNYIDVFVTEWKLDGTTRRNSRFNGKNRESAVAQFGVKSVAQRVAEEAEAEDGERDRKARENGDPRRRRGVFLGTSCPLPTRLPSDPVLDCGVEMQPIGPRAPPGC
jgi:hypothetical protein